MRSAPRLNSVIVPLRLDGDDRVPVAALRTPASRSRPARTSASRRCMVRPVSAATMSESSAQRSALAGSGRRRSRNGTSSDSVRSPRADDQQLAARAEGPSQTTGRSTSGSEARRTFRWRGAAARRAQVGEREPPLRGGAEVLSARITSSASVSKQARPNSSGSSSGPGSSATSGPATACAAEREAGRRRWPPARPSAQPSTTRSAIRTATSDHDGQLAPEQAALEALVGRRASRSKSSLMPGLPTAPVFWVLSQRHLGALNLLHPGGSGHRGQQRPVAQR